MLQAFFLTIRMLMVPVRFGRQPPPDADKDEASASKVVKHRIDRFFNGEWADLYEEANAGLVQPVHVKSEAEAAHVLAAKVEMKARRIGSQNATLLATLPNQPSGTTRCMGQ